MDKTFLAQTAAAFAYMVSEAVLGKTRFGSWLGLAKAIVMFIVGVVVGKVIGKRSGNTAAPNEETKNGNQ